MTTFAIPQAWGNRPDRLHRLRTPFRIPNDFYPTPPEATRALLSVEDFDGSIW